jgi:hypothetical protein
MSPQLESLERAIAEAERAAEKYAQAVLQESVLQDGRHGARLEAIRRLMEPEPRKDRRRSIRELHPSFNERRQYDHGHFGPPRASSASAAEKMLHLDEAYAAHLMAEREATLTKNMAYAKLVAWRLRALARLVDAWASSTHPAPQMVATEFDLDLIRAPHDDDDREIQGVPR